MESSALSSDPPELSSPCCDEKKKAESKLTGFQVNIINAHNKYLRIRKKKTTHSL